MSKIMVALNDRIEKVAGSSSKKGKEECGRGPEMSNPWPYRIKLTTDSMRWDSLKVLPSREFQHHILQKMTVTGCETLETWHPVEVSLYDVDTDETYKVTLVKKESFWFEPFPDVGQKKEKSRSCDAALMVNYSHEIEERRKDFVYSFQPFRHIVKKRSLRYDQEICLRWSGSETDDRIDFSVLRPPRLQLHTLRF